MFNALKAVFSDRKQPEQSYIASLVLAEYTTERHEWFMALLFDADERQLGSFTPKLPGLPVDLCSQLSAKLTEAATSPLQSKANEALIIAKANAAVALFYLGRGPYVSALLRSSPDPRLRTYIIHRCAPGQVDPGFVIKQLAEETDGQAKAALLLALGDYGQGHLPPSLQQQLRLKLIAMYRDDPDPGVHSATEWLMRRWHYDEDLGALDRGLVSRQPLSGRLWWVNSQGTTMAIIRGPIEFQMGSPPDEPRRAPGEDQELVRIPASFAIAVKEITVEQFLRSCPKDPRFATTRDFSPEPTCPMNGVNAMEAARYCLWLSRREGIPADQMCYQETGTEVVPTKDSPSKTGYRLPTEAEWEYACRANAITSRDFGQSDDLLSLYAWSLENSRGKTAPVGLLRPNGFGLFDILGNVSEWCHGSTVGDVFRGGTCRNPGWMLRSASRSMTQRKGVFIDSGFRVAKTLR